MLTLSIVFLLIYGGSIAALLLLFRNRPDQAAALQARLDAANELTASQKTELEELRRRNSETGSSLARKEAEANAISSECERLRNEHMEARRLAEEKMAGLQKASSELASLSESLKLTRNAFDETKAELAVFKADLASVTEARMQAASEAARLKAELDSATKRIEAQEPEMKRLQEESLSKFEALSSKLLEDKGRKFTELHADRLAEILNPLKEKIVDFKKRVEDVYEKESKDRTALQEQVRQMAEMNKQVSEDAKRLTDALKGDSKVMGDWGEVLLDDILEGSGLVEGQEYFRQESVRDADGKLLRPDITIKLPQGKTIIVDSKVSIAAYVDSCNASGETEREAAAARHVRSVRAHVDELAAKDYQSHVDGTLDYVVMFIPNEPAYNMAMRRDSSLWQYAYGRKIVLASPTNLFSILKIASELWRKDKEARNYLEIAEKGAAIYDKLAVFLDFMADVGKNLDDARKSYEKAVNNLKEGRGNLVGQAEKMRDLGLKTKRQIPEGWRDANGALPEAEEHSGEASNTPQNALPL